MPLLSPVQAFTSRPRPYDAMMRALLIVVLVLMLVPSWTGAVRLALLGDHPQVDVRRVMLDRHDPARTRVGALTFLGGVSLTSPDPAFGSFSSLGVHGERVTLLSDGGNVVSFRLDDRWHLSQPWFGNLPAGPGTGWEKADRDSESMAIDPDTRQLWVGFENSNEIWRFAPGFARAERFVAPRAMAKWYANGGPETLVRRRDGRFVTISETAPPHAHGRRAVVVFAGDPTLHPDRAFTAWYRPPHGYDVSDAAELPDGRLIIVNRRFEPPYRFVNKLTLVAKDAFKPGATVTGREIATLAPPLIHDNFEGIAVTQEAGATILWLVSDDNQILLQRSLLLTFRLDPGA